MSLTKLLIANRGEIAVRIIRAAKESGLRTVAVYAEGDADALHTRLADEAYGFEASARGGGYLDIDATLAIAHRSGADGVHPGYGFLAENAEFAAAVQSAGLVWIGPDPSTIELLGDKARARALAAAAGAPLVPGTTRPIAHVDEIFAFADEHGLPLVIKAVHGGGGRGIRVVNERDEIADSFAAAAREAEAAFGQGDCLVERFLVSPRHIEAQVLADRHGRVAVLGTRDCSLQRRNQKLVEEAPAPFLADDLRDRIQSSAADICRAADYVGAGTVEYLLGQDGTLTFLEVNTRLQVEHPVTEMVTGIDLVREQFRIAVGEPMRVPEVPQTFGHAIEFRINAEDPALGFLPTPGTIDRLVWPGGAGVRIDSGYEPGQAIPGSFDSLIAKIIVWGRDREEALERARRALAECEISGVATVLPFARAVAADPAWLGSDGDFGVHTRWIEEECAAVFEPAGAVAEPPLGGLARFVVEIDGKLTEVGVPAAVLASLAVGTPIPAALPKEAEASPGVVQVTHAGIVASWLAADGAEVAEGEAVLLLEAMKMETAIAAPSAGTLRHSVELGARVVAKQVVAVIS